ncbi:MAG: toll/interleukin-1 receptor domain-containing protein [Anaerolineae bacterium]|nr:toll/interleukin-1 receptor domain-containing protein [Anaerolineae bacterium]
MNLQTNGKIPMSRKTKIHLTYKTGITKRSFAPIIENLLTKQGYYVWSGQEIETGSPWDEEVYESIRRSDVVILLLQEGVAESQWVQREIDIARGANVSILPVQLIDDISESLDRFSLTDRQFIDLRNTDFTDENTISLLVETIDQLAEIKHKNEIPNVSNADFEKLGRSVLEAIMETQKDRGNPSGINFNPIFGKPSPLKKFRADIFVIMPFAPEFKPVYDEVIKPLEIDEGLALKNGIKRGDDFFSHHDIITEIWSAIYCSRLIIADCTGRNANVFYELGIAHTLGKPYILITQNVKDAPFDIQGKRLIEYQNTIAGANKLKADLKKAIQAILDGSD